MNPWAQPPPDLSSAPQLRRLSAGEVLAQPRPLPPAYVAELAERGLRKVRLGLEAARRMPIFDEDGDCFRRRAQSLRLLRLQRGGYRAMLSRAEARL